MTGSLFATKAQPHEVEGATHAYQESHQGEVFSVKEMVGSPADSAPKEEARYEVAEYRPERVLFAAISWFVGHAAMVDEF